MAVPANTVISAQQIGKKESVDNIMTNLTPYDTPFQTSIGRDSTRNPLFSWLEDSLRDVKDNAQQEGADATDDQQNQPSVLQNTTQIFSETYRVSRTADKTAVYGRSRESARLAVNAMKALKRDVENALVGTQQVMQLDNGQGVRRMAGAQAQIDASMTFTAGGAGASAPAPLTEDLVLDAAQGVYDAGAHADTILIKPSDARRFADFAYTAPASAGAGAVRARNVEQASKIINYVDVYQSAFGTQRVVLDRFLNPEDAIVYSSDMWAFVTFDPWSREPLAKTGDSDRTMIIGEFSLKHRNSKGSARITNLSK